MSLSVLKDINEAQRHRGPDDSGVYIEKNVGLAHRRLSIIDLEGGKQPFVDEKDKLVLVYNGEIYNFKEIRCELEGKYEFKTQSDTEVVLNAYKRWGMECLKYFRGMFAFALYDGPKNMLYLARDRVGIKPVYYYHTPDCFIFTSEFLPLLKYPHLERQICEDGLVEYLRYQYVPTPRTIYKDIYKLEPGHFLQVDIAHKSLSKVGYWDPEVKPSNKDEEDLLEEFNALLDDTIKIYIRSDVPFGTFLSGGVDSSIVTAVMGKYLDSPVRTFTIGYNEEKYSETVYARQVHTILKTEHHEQIVTPKISSDFLSTLVLHFGEPFSDSSAIPTYHVSELASKHVKMVLSGDGGDELFAGYDSYPVVFQDLANPLSKITGPVLRQIAKYSPSSRLRQKVSHHGKTVYEKHNSMRELYDVLELRRIMPGFTDIIQSSQGIRHKDPIINFQLQDFKTYLLDDILTKVDRMSMSNSLEVRVPLLDHKIIEYAFSLPLSLKLRWDKEKKRVITKYILKRSASRFFPEDLLSRPKMGFGIPITEWTKGELRVLIEDGLRNRNNEIFNWIDFKYAQELLDSHFKGENNYAAKIWNLLMLDLWIRNVHTRLSEKRDME